MRLPEPQGLYDPRNEKDACGVGFVCDIDGQASHAIVERGIEVLNNLLHRGAAGADAGTGDGAGILVQIPDRFFAASCRSARVRAAAGRPLRCRHDVPAARAPSSRIACRAVVEESLADGGPARSSAGERCRPSRRPGRVGARDPPGGLAVLHRLRPGSNLKRRPRAQALRRPPAVRASAARALGATRRFYVPSLSCRTIVYKGLMMATQVPAFYPDLNEPPVRERPGRRAPALQHQHLPLLGAGAAVPLPGAQRRDQHAARQPQLDALARAGAASPTCSATTSRSSCRSSRRAAATPPASTTCWSCWRPAAATLPARHADADPPGLGREVPDGAGPARLLRVPRRPHGAVGRPGGRGLHATAAWSARCSTATGCGRRATPSRRTASWCSPPRPACSTSRPSRWRRRARCGPGR